MATFTPWFPVTARAFSLEQGHVVNAVIVKVLTLACQGMVTLICAVVTALPRTQPKSLH